MLYEITINALTTLFVLILLLPLAINLLSYLAHAHRHPRPIRRTPDNRIWINDQDVTDRPIHSLYGSSPNYTGIERNIP